jgi:hypothetical protein
MKYESFAEGLEVRYRGMPGTVRFISNSYITVCMASFSERAKDVCVLVYPEQWKEVELIHGNRQSYEK